MCSFLILLFLLTSIKIKYFIFLSVFSDNVFCHVVVKLTVKNSNSAFQIQCNISCFSKNSKNISLLRKKEVIYSLSSFLSFLIFTISNFKLFFSSIKFNFLWHNSWKLWQDCLKPEYFRCFLNNFEATNQ